MAKLLLLQAIACLLHCELTQVEAVEVNISWFYGPSKWCAH